MGCCGQAEEGDEDKKARKQNREIEKQIQKDKQVRRQHWHVMVQIRDMCDFSSLDNEHSEIKLLEKFVTILRRIKTCL